MKVVKKILVVFLCVVLSLCSFVLFVVGGLNLAKTAIYKEYYSIERDVCVNPGLNDGFVCQGITYAESADKILVGGRMAKDEAARIYVTDENNDSKYVNVTNKDGKNLISHAGGLACYGDNVYIAAEDRLYLLSLQTILAAKNGDSVSVLEEIFVNNQASFVYIDDTTQTLYVGEFNHKGTKYLTTHPYGDNNAIIEKYALADLTKPTAKPTAIYSIPDKVQGFCAANGKFIMATSWAIGDSHYYVYDESEATPIADATFTDRKGDVLDGVPVYKLGACQRDVKGPAMAEGMDVMDGKVITMSESASNLYIFGKFFFATQVVSLDLL